MTLLWGAVTNNQPFNALKLVLQGKDPSKAPDIMDMGHYSGHGYMGNPGGPAKSQVKDTVHGHKTVGIFIADSAKLSGGGGKHSSWEVFKKDGKLYVSNFILGGPSVLHIGGSPTHKQRGWFSMYGKQYHGTYQPVK